MPPEPAPAKTPDWPTDRCAECGTTDGIWTYDAMRHPPLCQPCAHLWYDPHPEDDELTGP